MGYQRFISLVSPSDTLSHLCHHQCTPSQSTLHEQLSPLVGNSSSFVSSSSEFISFSKSINIPELVSFDVVSLFTNIPIDLALSVVEKRLDDVDVSDSHTPPKGSTSVTIEAVLVVYHLLLQWDCVPADLWHSNGVTGVSGCS